MSNGNGRSFPQVELTLNQLDVKNSRLETKTVLGVWKAGMPGNITFAPGKSLTPFKIISVYRVAVVVVSLCFFFRP